MVTNKNKNIISKLFKSKTSRIAFALFFASYILLIITYTGILDLNNLELSPTALVKILFIIALIISVSLFMFSYLEGNSEKLIKKRPLNGFESEDLFEVFQEFKHIINRDRFEYKEQLELILNRFNEKSRVEFKIESNDEIFKDLKKSIRNNIGEEFYNELNLNISKEVVIDKQNQFKDIIYTTRSIRERLLREIEKLDRKSNINLIVGSVMTILALICLGYVVLDKQDHLKTTEDILIHYIPRISFILFIEVFAFFFLRLYKLNLIDIKYYQNELTNIDLKNTSLVSSINFGVEKDISLVIAELSKTERNFILEKGQTTIEYEKFKYDEDSLKRFSKIFKNIINNK